MGLRPSELEGVVDELARELDGAVVQKVFSPSSKRCYLELRQVGRSTLVCVCTEPDLARLSVAAVRPPSPAGGSVFQRRLRKELVGLKLAGITREGPREIVLRFSSPEVRRALYAELGGRGDLVLLDDEGRPLAASEPRFSLPRARGPGRSEAHARAPSRLVPKEGVAFPLASAAEALVHPSEAAAWEERARARALAPLLAQAARLERTIAKVRVEADRREEAEAHRRFGELLAQNLFRLKRGEREVRLTEYTEAGPCEVVVPLDPARPPKEQAGWHFHKYRRLARGSELASARLATLLAEQATLAARLEVARAAPVEVEAQGPPVERPRRKAPAARPYREYTSVAGQRIWVGKGGEDNDALTFRVARPDDLWLHARGVPGAHVVVPMDKGAEIPQELLLDAAHLALHHAKTKGEPRGEVSYTRAKFVKKPKGSAPGEVSYTREKTFMLKVDPGRLARLLGS